MATALDFIKQTMRKAGILAETETPTASQASDALTTLNDMLDSWANDGLLVPYRTLESFTLTGGTQNYTIGTGGAFNTIRPIQIISAYVRDGGSDYNLTRVDDSDFASITSKDTQSIPEYMTFTNAYPLATISIYPIPASAYSIYLLSEKIIGNYALSTTIDLPPGWNRAVKNNLAVELCNEYGQEIPNGIAAIAADALAKIKVQVAKNRPIDAAPVGSSRNIFSGWGD